VFLRDADSSALQRAADLGAGLTTKPSGIELVVVCVPPAATVEAVREVLAEFPSAVVTDVASIKAPVLTGLAGAEGHDRFVGGHPLAGREVSGPAGARSDLFEGRAWVLTPNGANDGAIALVREAVESMGATVLEMSAVEHDRAVALVSHVPQLMASLTAARLEGAEARSVAVAGQGLRDVTRIAASDPSLWSEIVDGNAEPVLEVLDAVQQDLAALIDGLRSQERAKAVHDIVRRGNTGQARIPGKHGERARRYTDVPVVIPDEPGALARLFDLAGAARVNIEDLSLEHSPGQPVGLATLRVLPEHAESFAQALRAAGLTVHL
jgi:prephenate dehydrogenase